MPKTATREIHRDNFPLFTGTHQGGDYESLYLLREEGDRIELEDLEGLVELEGEGSASSTLYVKGANFRALGVDPSLELYCINESRGTGGTVTAATENTVTVDGVEWYNGDTYAIYQTSSKGSFISAVWTDVSAGFKINHPDEINRHGWRKEDWDIDDRGRKRVFGPGQPEKN